MFIDRQTDNKKGDKQIGEILNEVHFEEKWREEIICYSNERHFSVFYWKKNTFFFNFFSEKNAKVFMIEIIRLKHQNISTFAAKNINILIAFGLQTFLTNQFNCFCCSFNSAIQLMKRYKMNFAIYELITIYSNHQYNGELVSLTLGAFSAPILYMTVKLTLSLVPL
jgi:hypothetical protein